MSYNNNDFKFAMLLIGYIISLFVLLKNPSILTQIHELLTQITI